MGTAARRPPSPSPTGGLEAASHPASPSPPQVRAEATGATRAATPVNLGFPDCMCAMVQAPGLHSKVANRSGCAIPQQPHAGALATARACCPGAEAVLCLLEIIMVKFTHGQMSLNPKSRGLFQGGHRDSVETRAEGNKPGPPGTAGTYGSTPGGPDPQLSRRSQISREHTPGCSGPGCGACWPGGVGPCLRTVGDEGLEAF